LLFRWSGYLGAEYLGDNIRYPISPFSERYFLFICSSFREKSGTGFKSLKYYDSSYVEIVQELANLCSIATFSFYIFQEFDLADLRRIVSGSIYSNCWVILEQFNNLKLEMIRIICKEILILQQKYILTEINNENEIYRKILIKNDENQEEKDNKINLSKADLNNINDKNKNDNINDVFKEDFIHISENNNNSALNSNYFKKYDSLENEHAIIKFYEDSEKKAPIPSINKQSNKKDVNRVAHGLFITYHENPITLNEINALKNEKMQSLQSCFRFLFPRYLFFF